MLTPINFSNSWPESSDRKHNIWKNHETQSIENKTLNDDLKKNRQENKIIVIKKIKVKIERKNKLKGSNKFLFWELNWKK
jgi:mevalonate pyrophosphate decarboxylase